MAAFNERDRRGDYGGKKSTIWLGGRSGGDGNQPVPNHARDNTGSTTPA
jgi:hypothetical protein